MSTRRPRTPVRGGHPSNARRLLFCAVGLLAGWALPAAVGATTPTPAPTPKPCQLCGDANGSGTVDIVDALVISQTTGGLRTDPPCVLQGDVDADGQVSIVDALFISQLTVNLPATLTCPGCGNGRLDLGEQCDPPGAGCASGEACSADCGCVVCHAICATGAPLAAGCDACVANVCAADPACCSAAWDAKCVGEANVLCGTACPCESCGSNVCGNRVCEQARGETECNCAADCTGAAVCASCEAVVASCPNGLCDSCVQGGESPETCPADCPPFG